MRLSAKDKKLIRQIQGDLPVSPTPFKDLSQKLGWEEEELLRKVKDLQRRGLIRRFGAILRHQIAGYRGNAMAVWRVSKEQIPQVGLTMASFPAVSHCYLRPASAKWPYNMYTMIHGQNERDCRRVAQEIARATGLKEYRLLFSRRDHKKSSMAYFA